ncbi:MAG: hypothetical protein L6R36_004072 [Xanthoria steineri]|nr:MAG: hypothetical protein L6R36_004072 [Xanthoria steineri]
MRPAWPLWPSSCFPQKIRPVRHASLRRLRSSLVRPPAHLDPSRPTEAVPTETTTNSQGEPRDHRAIASSHDLYAFHTSSPGSPLFHPSGTHLLQKLQAFLRAQYPSYGFQEVLTPTIYKKSLWEQSGHWANYKEDMFAVAGRGAQGGDDPGREIGEDEEYGLKPMNCPGHCLLFKSQKRSYKDLPIRYADFSPLHRNELSGALSGLTRLRRFHQDDGHVFCRPLQVKTEISRTLDFVRMVYRTLNMGNYRLRLGTRPEQYIGSVDDWDRAEARLQKALQESGQHFYINQGDGAFYGPKIDVIVTDADGKDHQTATIQLDFQLPQRFELAYDVPEPEQQRTAGSKLLGSTNIQSETPVLIHRAIFGSLERFLALLIESDAGKWPFWMNPHQLVILTVGQEATVRQRAEEIAKQLASPDARTGPQTLKAQNFMVDCDNTDQSLAKKIFNARRRGYSFFAVFGRRNLEQPPEMQTLDVSLAVHPSQQDVQQAIEAFMTSRLPPNDSLLDTSMMDSKPTATRLTIRQCQDLMKDLESRFL